MTDTDRIEALSRRLYRVTLQMEDDARCRQGHSPRTHPRWEDLHPTTRTALSLCVPPLLASYASEDELVRELAPTVYARLQTALVPLPPEETEPVLDLPDCDV